MSELMSAVKENGVIEGQFRDLNTITYEIRTIYHNVLEYELISAVRLGRKLQEAKSIVGHGEWGKWIKNNLPFSQDKAEIMLKIYKNYGSSQESIFGELNSDIYRNLGVSQAFALLSVPEEEREDFVKENKADEMSVRELKKAIAERDAAKAEQEKAEAERDAMKTRADALNSDNQMLRQSNAELNKKAQSADKAIKDAQAETADARQKAADADLKISAEKEKTLVAERKEKAAKEELEKLKKNPEIPAEVLERIRAEAEETAKSASETEMQERDRRIAVLEKKLAMASPEIAAFKTHFTQLQETQRKIEESLARIRTADAATAEKLLAAIAAAEKAFAERVGVNA